jgi:hypothetical protein
MHFGFLRFSTKVSRIILKFAFSASLLSSALMAQSSNPPTQSDFPAPEELLDAAERAMGSPEALASIGSITAIAACRGPKSDYQTRIISGRRGNLSFQQFFADHKNRGEILDGRGWELGDDGRSEWLGASEISVLRGHEFPLMALDLSKRFHAFKTVGITQFEGQPVIQIAMTEELGHSAAAFFSLSTHLSAGLTVQSARSGETFTIRFDSWKMTSGVNLVNHVTILLGSDPFVFDFKTLILNAADDAAFQIPGGPPKLPQSK